MKKAGTCPASHDPARPAIPAAVLLLLAALSGSTTPLVSG